MKNKPHHGIINNGVLTWVNEPKAVAMSERLTDMIAEDLQKNKESHDVRQREHTEITMRFLSGDTDAAKKVTKEIKWRF